MGATSTEGTGNGSAEGPIRGLGDVSKILQQTIDEVAFALDDEGQMRSQISGGDGATLASDVTVIPTGNLASNNVQDALEEHQTDIDTANDDIDTNTSDIATNASDLNSKADKVSAPVIGDFAGLDGNGNLANSGRGPDDYYTQAEIDALTYDHESLTGLQGGASSDHKHLTASQHTNLTGNPTFSSVTLSGSVDDNTDAATKGYVDGAVAGISDWLEAVLDFKTEATATETLGFRYIASADGGTWTENNVYEYNGAGWDETVVVSGNSTYVDGESAAYVFNGTIWTKMGGISDHNSLSGLQGGEANHYWHLKEDAKTFVESVVIAGVAEHEFLQYNAVAGEWQNVPNPTEVAEINTDTDLDAAGTTTGVYFVDTSGGDVTITISNAAAINSGNRMSFFKHTDDANQVIITTIGGVQKIGGYTSQTISKNHQGFTVTSHWFGASGEWHVVVNNRNDQRIITVSTENGEADYNSIADAIAQINSLGDASTSKRYVIQLTPGIFTEAPFTLPDYVSLMGTNDECTFVKASNNAAAFITLGHDTVLYNLRVDGPTTDIAAYSDDEAEIVRCIFQNAQTCIQSDTVTGNITVEETKFKSSCTNGLHATNSGNITASNIYSEVTGNAYFSDGGVLLLHNSFSSGATNHLYCDDDGTLHCHLINCLEGTNVARTGTNGTANTVHGIAVTADDNSTWHILQEGDNADIHLTGCMFLATKLSMVNAATIETDFNSGLAGDKGHLFLEEVQVGVPEQGRETVLGEGDSYTRGMLVYTRTAIGAFTDVSTEAASASGSAFTFPDVAANNAIYISSDLQDSSDYKQFLGIKASITVAAVPGVGEIVAEYWNGAAWTEFNHMSTLSDAPYTQQADAIFERTGSEQIRFQDLTLVAVNWTKNDPPTEGTNRFWVRFRIATGITTAPIFEQFKIHSNRTEINADGFLEHMGKARKEAILPGVNLGNTRQLETGKAKDQKIDYGAILHYDTKDNKFESDGNLGFGQIVTIPQGLDTSLPLTLKMRWAPDGSDTGGVEYTFTRGKIKTGTVLNGAQTEIVITDVISGALVEDTVYETEFSFSEPSLLPGDQVPFAITRDGGNGNDTYGENTYAISLELFGWFWQ